MNPRADTEGTHMNVEIHLYTTPDTRQDLSTYATTMLSEHMNIASATHTLNRDTGEGMLTLIGTTEHGLIEFTNIIYGDKRLAPTMHKLKTNASLINFRDQQYVPTEDEIRAQHAQHYRCRGGLDCAGEFCPVHG